MRTAEGIEREYWEGDMDQIDKVQQRVDSTVELYSHPSLQHRDKHDLRVELCLTSLRALLAMRDELRERDAVIAGLMHDYGEYIGSMDVGCAETISDIMQRVATNRTPDAARDGTQDED